MTFAKERWKSKRWDMSIVSGFLKFYKNTVMEDMMLTWPQEARVNVDWLTFEEAVMMLEAAKGPERIVIHLELRLWLRRCEVRRLTQEDIQPLRMYDPRTNHSFDGIMNVHGKGRAGGKWRTLAWAPETKGVVEEYDRIRQELIHHALARHPDLMVPSEYIIYEHTGGLAPYGKSGIDSIVQRVAKRAGIKRKIWNHTLRRTGARIAYFAGVELVEIMEGLGHSNEKETIKYLGLTVNELGSAQIKVYEFLKGVKQKMEAEGRTEESISPTRVSW